MTPLCTNTPPQTVPLMGANGLSVSQAMDLYDGLKTLLSVGSALLCQPRYLNADDTPNPAGDVIENIWDDISHRMDALRRFIGANRCEDEWQEASRLAFLVKWEIGNDREVADAVIGYAKGILQDRV